MTSIDFLNKVHKSLDSQEYSLSYRDHADPNRGGIERPYLGRGIPHLHHRESGI